jgi:lysophospholipase L1-like esterase
MSVICVFGDSITWGAYDLELGGWVDRLRIYFDNKGDFETDIYNCGVSGDNVADVLTRFDTEAKARTPDKIILSIGINDTLHTSNPKGTSLEDFEKQYRHLLEKAKKFTTGIIILGLTNVDETSGDHGYKNDQIEKYDRVIRQIAEEESLPFVDLFSTLSIGEFEDGLHPNAKGHRKIFEKVKEVSENDN